MYFSFFFFATNTIILLVLLDTVRMFDYNSKVEEPFAVIDIRMRTHEDDQRYSIGASPGVNKITL